MADQAVRVLLVDDEPDFLKGSSLEQLGGVLQVALRMIERPRSLACDHPVGFGGWLLDAARRLFTKPPTPR